MGKLNIWCLVKWIWSLDDGLKVGCSDLWVWDVKMCSVRVWDVVWEFKRC